MSFFIGLVIGLALSAAVVYYLMSRRSAAQSRSVEDLHRQLDLVEAERDRRLHEELARLRQQYEAQQAASPSPPAPSASTPIRRPPETPITPPPAVAPTEPPPQPESEADDMPPPVVATSPAPVPQPVSNRSAAPPPESSETSDPATLSASNPTLLMAASYSPDASVRQEVADEIANTVSTANVAVQARWMPILSRLSRDPDPEVRLRAVRTLGHVKTTNRLPLLRRALRDSEPAVVEAANAAISRTKGRSQMNRPPQKRRLPKNR